MRIVLDTSVIITALRSGTGAAAEVVRLSLLRRLTILMDYKLACEYRDVALRSEQLNAAARTATEVEAVVDALELVAEPVLVFIQHRPLSQDPNDDMVMDVAVNGIADAIVTNNLKHFESAAARFRIPVLRPADLLRRLRSED